MYCPSPVRSRYSSAARIDAAISAWTGTREAAEIEIALQASRVPAHGVVDMHELYADPQLAHRSHFVEIPHPAHEKTTIEASRFRLSRTPARVPDGAPTFGAHNREILEEILGYDAERIAALESSGALV